MKSQTVSIKRLNLRWIFMITSNTLQHTISIASIENSPTNTPLATEHTEVFDSKYFGGL